MASRRTRNSGVEVRSGSVRVSFSEDELVELDRRKGSMARAAYLARGIRETGSESADPATVEAILSLKYEIRKVGTNLNQIARGINSDGWYSPQRIEDCLDELMEVLGVVKTASGRFKG